MATGERPLPSLHPASLLATWFGAGLLPVAPGTWGSLAALPFAWAIATLLGQPALLVAAAMVFCVGWWAATQVGRASGITDDGSIVIDEVAGQWLTLAVVPPSAAAYVLGFLLFRVFDITKPWPARTAERRIPGGLGVMADDIVAGVYAALLLYVLHVIGRGFFGR
ncbi:MAG TPA: phosphatidylglycerophosphatase A [Stellaceae bacterium]|nr:phosphatidylglycerophosphatase A [Stellaceae bacterium]